MRACASFLCALFVCLALVAPALSFSNPNGFRKNLESRGTSTLKQVTREQIVARSKVRPAKRQTSAAPYPTCPDSPATAGVSFATFIDTAPATGTSYIGSLATANYAGCQELCASNANCRASYFTANSCYLYASLGNLYNAAGYSTLLENTSCAAQVAADPTLIGLLCCNSFVAPAPSPTD